MCKTDSHVQSAACCQHVAAVHASRVSCASQHLFYVFVGVDQQQLAMGGCYAKSFQLLQIRHVRDAAVDCESVS